MIKNVGSLDRTLRLIGAAVLLILFFTGTLSGTVGIISLILAVMLVVTSFAAWCPIYLPFRIFTNRKQTKQQ